MSEHKFSDDFTTITLHDHDYQTILRALKVLAVELADENSDDSTEVDSLLQHLREYW